MALLGLETLTLGGLLSLNSNEGLEIFICLTVFSFLMCRDNTGYLLDQSWLIVLLAAPEGTWNLHLAPKQGWNLVPGTRPSKLAESSGNNNRICDDGFILCYVVFSSWSGKELFDSMAQCFTWVHVKSCQQNPTPQKHPHSQGIKLPTSSDRIVHEHVAYINTHTHMHAFPIHLEVYCAFFIFLKTNLECVNNLAVDKLTRFCWFLLFAFSVCLCLHLHIPVYTPQRCMERLQGCLHAFFLHVLV